MKKQFFCQKMILFALIITTVVSSHAQQKITITATYPGNIMCNKTCIRLDVPDLNNNPDAIIISVTPVFENGVNPNPWTISVGYNLYNDFKWSLKNQGNQNIKNLAKFDVIYYAHPDTSQFVQVVTDYPFVRDGSAIDHAGLNDNPNAQFQFIQNVTPQAGRFYNLADVTINYVTKKGRWCIFNKDNTKVPAGAAYNIAIAPGPAVIKTFGGKDSSLTELGIKNISTSLPPAVGQVLKWNGTAWAPGDDNTTCTANKNNNASDFWSLSGDNLYSSNQGFVGIDWKNPNAPLGFSPSLGKKISLYPGATGDVGFAVQGNLLQIYADNPNADVALGYDQSGTFKENFRVKANGALSVNGSTGQPGQILQSNGPDSPPTWVNPCSSKFDALVMGCTQSVLTPGDSDAEYDVIPGLDQTINTSTPSTAIVYFTGLFLNKGCNLCGSGMGNIKLYIDEMEEGSTKVSEFFNVNNRVFSSFSTSIEVFTLEPGIHHFKVRVERFASGGDVEILPNGTNDGTRITLIIIPK